MIEYSKMLRDPTTFAYLFLRLDNKKVELYPYQDMVLNDPHRFIYFRASNQIGKSMAFNIKAVHNLIIDHGFAHNEAIVSKSLPQSLYQMRRIKGLLNSMKYVKWSEDKGSTDNTSIITVDIKDDKGDVKYTNMLVCVPCTEGLLGYDLHSLNLDEFEYWEIDIEHFYNQIAEPRTYHTKGKIFIMSNPNGQDNFGAKLEGLVMPGGTKKFHTYVFNFLDKPGNTENDLEIAKVGKSRQEIESTLLAIRSLSDRNYFTRDEIDRSYDKDLTELKMVNQQPFFFLDVGAKHDQSVLVGGFVSPDDEKKDVNGNPFLHFYIPIIHNYPVGYPLTRTVGVQAPDEDGWHYERSVKDYILEWSKGGVNPIFGCDITGNSGMIPLFNAIGVNPIDVTFSGPQKSGMYQRFKYLMEKGLVHRIKHPDWEDQMARLLMKKSVRGYMMIHHESERDLDDCPDATAGFIYLADNPEIAEVTMQVFNKGDLNNG